MEKNSILYLCDKHMIIRYDVSNYFFNTKDFFYLNTHRIYFKKELGKLPIEKLWEIIEKLSSGHKIPDKTKMSYEQILELCIILKEADELFRNLEQISIFRMELNK